MRGIASLADLRARLAGLPAGDDSAAAAIAERQSRLTKPLGSLGRLEEAGRLAWALAGSRDAAPRRRVGAGLRRQSWRGGPRRLSLSRLGHRPDGGEFRARGRGHQRHPRPRRLAPGWSSLFSCRARISSTARSTSRPVRTSAASPSSFPIDRPIFAGRSSTRPVVPSPATTSSSSAAERRFWTPESRRVEHALLGRDGRFDFSNLPAGDYLLAAVTHLDADDLDDPAWLEAVAAMAVHTTLADGEHKVQDIRLGHSS